MTEEGRVAMLELGRLCAEKRKDAKRKSWQEFAQNIGKNRNLKGIWNDVNRVRGKKHKFVAHPNPDKVAIELVDKWGDAARVDALPSAVRDGLTSWEDNRRKFILAAINTGDVTCREITKDELIRARKMGRSTSPGEDGVTYDILNVLASMDNNPLLRLFNMSFKEGIPKKWKRVIMIPIPKPNGDFRPISLISCFSKMMERIILNRLLYAVGDRISSNIFGFIKGKSTSDCVIKCLSKEDKYKVFIDLEGAFDKANER